MTEIEHVYSPYIPQVVGCVMAEGARTAVKYVDRDFVVKATRTHRSSLDRRQTRQTSLIVTWGKPNYAERRFIHKCVAAGEPFPVKNVQYKLYPPKPRKR